MLKRFAHLLPLLIVVAPIASAQKTEMGGEVQAYPTGIVTAVGAKMPLKRDGSFFTFRIGYNQAHRNDNGERGDERGEGPGASVGWQRMFFNAKSGLFLGARADLWFLKIDWIDLPGQPGQTSGTTDIVILQPMGRVGYRYPFGLKRNWSFEPALSFGIEWNVDTDGADVGEGPILLLGATVSRRF